METWRKIAGSQYLVSNEGRIKSLRSGRILKPWLNCATGYPQVRIGGRKKHSVHRLVACAFLGEFPDLFVNHKDGSRTNNNVENLEWVTHSGNMKHAHQVLKVKNSCHGKYGAAHPCSKSYIATSLDGSRTFFFTSGTDAILSGFSSSGISHCVSGKIAHHKGYKWRLAQHGVKCAA